MKTLLSPSRDAKLYLVLSLSSSLVAAPVSGAVISYPSDNPPLYDPQAYYGNANLPAAPNSLFPPGSPNGNTVTVQGSISGHVYGGIQNTDGANATNNAVLIENGTIGNSGSSPGGNVTGGWSLSGSAINNAVTIENSPTVRGIVYGGWVRGGGGETYGNTVTISGSPTLQGNVYGGYSQGTGSVYTNTVTISGGSLTNNGGIIAGGYTAIGGSNAQVYDNKVSLENVTIRNSNIYGGRGNTTGAGVHGNEVVIDSGTVIQGGNIYGGEIITGAGTVYNNLINITGGTINATLYGGRTGGSGNVLNNAVSITDASISGDIYGGYSARGLVSGNTVSYGVSNAANTITFGGAILGASSLTKTGAGTLALTGDNSNIDGVISVQDGTLQLGNGGTSGGIATSSSFFVNTGAALAYQHTNDVTETQRIIGPGTVIQRGTGTLTLQNRSNNFTGGTEIESGTLNIVNDNTLGSVVQSYNQTSLANFMTYGPTAAGYITFTGADTGQAKKVIVDSVGLLTNSFRTKSGAGNENYVDLTVASIWDGSAYTAMIANVFTADRGGAFSVAGGTTMHVDVANNLVLANNLTQFPSQLQWNDLYVGSGGTFNLNLDSAVATFASGIDGEGTLNINGNGTTRLQTMANLPSAPYPQNQIFHMGATNVGTENASGSDQTILSLMRTDSSNPRVTFSNTNTFNLGGGNGLPLSAVLMGDGILTANTINVNSGTLAPTFLPTTSAGTLTLTAPTINLNDFALLYMAYGPQAPLTFDGGGIPISNNDLLNLVTHGSTVNLANGAVYFVTSGNTPLASGNFLVMRSDNGFDGISIDSDLNAKLTATVDGFVIDSAAPRSGSAYSFQLGGDPDPTNGTRTSGTNNVWFTNSLNSLTMEWTGGSATALRSGGSWESGQYFSSLQTGAGGVHEQNFMTGDKVSISGDNTFAIDLPAATLASKIVVSGLVVGEDVSGNITNGGNYTIGGAGGIIANAATAFGGYVNSGGADALIPTGKLEKYGDSILTFTNTGGNSFDQGIDLYGGTVAFDRADQLAVGDGQVIAFKENATLQSNDDVTLDTPISIDQARIATLQVENDKTLLLAGSISGDGSLTKTGNGTLALTSDNTYTGGTTISAGTLQLGDGGATGSIIGDVADNGTLAFNRSDTYNFDGIISGTGAVAQMGAGTTLLTSDNTYTGGTAISAGTLQLGDGGETGSIIGDVANNGTLAFDRSDTYNFDGVISGTGAVTQMGAGTTLLTSDNTYTGGTTISAGTLQLGDGGATGSIIGDVANNGTLAFNRSDTYSFDGVISGTGSVEQMGAGTTILTSDSTYTGGTAISAGTLQLGDGGTTGSIIGDVADNGTLAFNRSDTYSFDGVISGTGAVAQMGAETLILTGASTYTGETTVSGGTLNVEGSIASSSLTTVNSGTILTGTGTVGNTTIATGGTFAPGNGTPESAMAVAGDLSLQVGSRYVSQLDPDTASLAKVEGTAMPGGATVDAIYANGDYVAKRYTILTATGGVSGTFNELVQTNLPPNFHPSLGYDANNAYLDLSLHFGTPEEDLNSNQENVGDSLSDFFDDTGSIREEFGNLTPDDLTQSSGELATASQQATFDAMNQFIGLMSDPTLAGRSECGLGTTSERQTAIRRGESDCLAQPWSVWTMAYGGRRTTDGDAGLGSHSATNRIYGVAVGADYHIAPNTLTGFALAGGGSNFDMAGGLGSGNSSLIQFGAFMQQTIANAYLRAALAYGWQDITTNRTVAIDGSDQLQADFNANAFSGRLEGGYRFDMAWGGFTPYAAGQFTTLNLPDYGEQVHSGGNTFALRYDGETVTTWRSELGLRAGHSFALADGPLTLNGRLAWAHNFDNERQVTAEFQALPGASFQVNGAAIDGDAALATISLEMKWRNGWSAALAIDSELSDASRLYAGWGLLRYQW